jgi:hypothetical protein
MCWVDALVYPHDVEKGFARFSTAWVDANGAPPPRMVELRRADHSGEPKFLRTTKWENGNLGISVGNPLFDEIAKQGEQCGVKVQFRAARFWRRVRRRRAARRDLIVAVVALLAVIASAVAALVTGLSKTSAPGWLLVGVFGLVYLAAVGKLLQDVHKADV